MYILTAAYGDSRIIEVEPSIVSTPVVFIVILFVFAFPASSFTVKNCPALYPEAAGNLISMAADAETPKILELRP